MTTVPVAPSAARTTTGTSSGAVVPRHVSQIAVLLEVSAASGTTPTLDLTVEWSDDAGVTWFVADPAQAMAQVTAAAAKIKQFPVLADQMRVRWTIAGTTPSFTFAVDYWML